MRTLIIWILITLLFQDTNSNKLFFKENFTLYQFFDPGIDCAVNVDEAFLWNFSKSVTPCYKTIDVSMEGSSINMSNSDGRKSNFEIQKKGIIKCFAEATTDPYLGEEIEINYQYGLDILKSNLEVRDKWNDSDVGSFVIPTNSELKGLLDLDSIDSLKLTTGVSLNATVEAIDQLFLPYNTRRVNLISFDYKFRLKSIDKKTRAGWIPVSEQQVKSLPDHWISSRKVVWKYMSEDKPNLLAELHFHDGYKCKNFYFFNDQSPSSVAFCNSSVEKIFLFPNPSFGQVQLLMENISEDHYYFKIYNVIGQEIWVKEVIKFEDQDLYDLNLSSLGKGTYLYAVTDKNNKRLLTKKLVILGI